jgi:hypothetical protein
VQIKEKNFMTAIENLKLLGFKVKPIKETRITIGKTEYVVKSVFTGKNQKTMSETFLNAAQNRAFNVMEKQNCKQLHANDSNQMKGELRL